MPQVEKHFPYFPLNLDESDKEEPYKILEGGLPVGNLTLKEIEAILPITRTHLVNLCRSGKIPFKEEKRPVTRIGRDTVITVNPIDVKNYLEARGNKKGNG